MPAIPSNFTITADGAYDMPVTRGQRYALGASSASWAGSLAIGWKSAAGHVVAFPNSPLTANGGFEFTSPTAAIVLTASGTIGTTEISLAKAQ